MANANADAKATFPNRTKTDLLEGKIAIFCGFHKKSFEMTNDGLEWNIST
jgi:hypothetical protein